VVSSPGSGRPANGVGLDARVAPAAEAVRRMLSCLAEGDDFGADIAARYALDVGATPLDLAQVVLDGLADLRSSGAGLLTTSDAEVRARRLFVRLIGPPSRRGRRALLFVDRPEALTVAVGMVLELAGLRVSTVVSPDPTEVLHLACEQPWDEIVVDHGGLRRSARTVRELLAPALCVERRGHVVIAGEAPDGVDAVQRCVAWVPRDLRPIVLACGVLPADPLTQRERDVLSAVAAGRSNEQIGRQLQLSLSTVKTYLERIHGKLGSVDRASAVATAVRGGWI
jgi:DNA-binding CsgD family transcriptional regulator